MENFDELFLLEVEQHSHPDFLTPLDPFSEPPEQLLGARGAPSGRVWFRGGWTCNCVATSLPLVEEAMLQKGLIQNSIDIYQLGYNAGGVSASAGTHDLGGCVDVGQDSNAQIDEWRLWGWTMQARTRAQGFDPHAHGWPFGCPHLSSGARHQDWQWKRRTNGLASYGPIQGRWPVKGWKTALNEGIKRMGFVEDVTKSVRNGLADEIAKAVLTKDGLIPNVFTGNEKNTHVTLATALNSISNKVANVDKDVAQVNARVDTLAARIDDVKALNAKIDALTKALNSIQPKI